MLEYKGQRKLVFWYIVRSAFSSRKLFRQGKDRPQYLNLWCKNFSILYFFVFLWRIFSSRDVVRDLQTYKMESFGTTLNSFQPLTIVADSILNFKRVVTTSSLPLHLKLTIIGGSMNRNKLNKLVLSWLWLTDYLVL